MKGDLPNQAPPVMEEARLKLRMSGPRPCSQLQSPLLGAHVTSLPHSHGDVLTSGTSKPDCIWRQAFCRADEVKVSVGQALTHCAWWPVKRKSGHTETKAQGEKKGKTRKGVSNRVLLPILRELSLLTPGSQTSRLQNCWEMHLLLFIIHPG